MNAWRIGAIGIVAYLLILLVTFPATRLTGSLEQRVDGLLLRDVSGSPWSGQAAHVLYKGADIGAMQWQFRPLRLFTGNLEYRLSLQDPRATGSALLDVSFAGRTHGRQLDLQLAPSDLINRFSPVGVVADGTLRLRLDEFELVDGMPGQVKGQLQWQGAQLRAPVELSLGDLRMDVASAAPGLVATVAEGGTLGLTGSITLQAGGNYDASLQLQPAAGLDEDTTQLLDTLLRRRPGGGYQLVARGSL
jgi:hypothetical protein